MSRARRNHNKRRRESFPRKIPASALALDKLFDYNPVLEDFKATPTSLYGWFWGKVPSVNKLTLDIHKTHRRASTAEVRRFKRGLKEILAGKQDSVPASRFYKLVIWVAKPCYTAGGQVEKWDVSNYLKVAEDGLTEALGFDDSRIARIEGVKVQTTGRAAWAFELTVTENPQ